MTCQELGGACDIVFEANSFDEMAELSKSHSVEMITQKDEAHISAMKTMQELMKDAEAMQLWFENKKTIFENLPET